MAASLDHRTQQTDGPPVDEEKIGGRVFCHSAHTHAPLRGARFLFSPAGRTTFSGGENHAPQNRAKTPTENKRSKGTQKKQKGPRLGHRGQNPKQETRTTGKPGFGSPRATTPTSAKNDLDLVDERGREGKEAEEEQAIPNRANRKYKK